jgi:hypothetical protein
LYWIKYHFLILHVSQVYHEFGHPYSYFHSHVFDFCSWQRNCNFIIICCFKKSILHPPWTQRLFIPLTSQYSITSLDYNPLNCNINLCKTPCKYQNIHFNIIWCSMLGFVMCLFITLMEYTKSNHVHKMTYIKDPMSPW